MLPIECKYINKDSSIINSEQALKIKSYFPDAKQNFKLQNIYNGSRDGWEFETYKQKVFNQGPTLIILKTTEGAICGGYTSKDWDGSGKWTEDIDAFVFNMTQKYIPNDSKKAIYTNQYGSIFGADVLKVTSLTTINKHNEGWCKTGKDKGYDIEGDVSPLTNQKNEFTCAQLEVYKVIFS
jgi:hypothetical protein